MEDFLKASKDDSMREIALANYALAAFETGKDELAVKTAQTILRKDPEFWDMLRSFNRFPLGHREIWIKQNTSGKLCARQAEASVKANRLKAYEVLVMSRTRVNFWNSN